MKLLPTAPGFEPTERLCHTIGRAILLDHELRKSWHALSRQQQSLSQEIGAVKRDIDGAREELRRFNIGPRGYSKEDLEAKRAHLEDNLKALQSHLEELLSRQTDLDARTAEVQRCQWGHGAFVEKIEGFVRTKLHDADLLREIETLKTSIAGNKINGTVSGKLLLLTDQAAANLKKLREKGAHVRAQLVAVEQALLPVDDVRARVMNGLGKVKHDSARERNAIRSLQQPGRGPDLDTSDWAMLIWILFAEELTDEAIAERLVQQLGKPMGLPASERGAELKRLRVELAEIDLVEAVEVIRLEEELGFSVSRTGQEGAAATIEVCQRRAA